MSVKAALVDAVDTLLDTPTTLQPGAEALVNGLQDAGLSVYITSNDKLSPQQMNAIPVPRHRFLIGEDIGKKGKGGMIGAVTAREGLRTNQLVYIGNSDFDMQEASNNRVVLLTADWVPIHTPYGIHCTTPNDALECVTAFFLKDHLWYAKVDEDDALGRPVRYRGLMSNKDAENIGLKTLLKTGYNGANVQGFELNTFSILHLFASAYLEGIHFERGPKDHPTMWCIFPGSKGVYNEHLCRVLEWTTRTLKQTSKKDLLVRHTDAVKKAFARGGPNPPDIDNDFNTLIVNPLYKGKFKDRTVVVLDDFSTYAHGFETARNLLLAAGAHQVYGISVGKFGSTYPIRYPLPGLKLPVHAKGVVDPKLLGRQSASIVWDENARQYYKH